jgi:hypothetical protein
MFAKYDEIAKVIRSYIEESLTHITGNAQTLANQIEEMYHFSLSVADITNLGNAITIAKQARSDYNTGLQNSKVAVTDWANALEKSKELAASKEGNARSYAYSLANKICMGTYKGPLTMDTMKELKEHGYDGTYGSTTMIQMYSLYIQNQNLLDKSKQDEATIAKQAASNSQYEQAYRNQFIAYQNEQNKNKGLIAENENLKLQNSNLLTKIEEQTKMIQSLGERIDALSKKWSTQIMETLKGVFRPSTVPQFSDNINPVQTMDSDFVEDNQKVM